MTKFLKSAWLTIKAAPMWLGTVAALAPIIGQTVAPDLPSNLAAVVIRWTVVAGVAATALATAVTRVSPVVKEARGFPAAPLSQKEQIIVDLQAQVAQLRVAAQRVAQDAALAKASVPAPVAVVAPVVAAPVAVDAPAPVDVPAAA